MRIGILYIVRPCLAGNLILRDTARKFTRNNYYRQNWLRLRYFQASDSSIRYLSKFQPLAHGDYTGVIAFFCERKISLKADCSPESVSLHSLRGGATHSNGKHGWNGFVSLPPFREFSLSDNNLRFDKAQHRWKSGCSGLLKLNARTGMI